MTRARSRSIPWIWIISAIAAIAVGLVGYQLLRPKSTTSTPTRETATVQQGDFRVSVSGPGTLEAAQTLEVKPKINATVLSLPAVGDRVQKGQLIVWLDPSEYTRSLNNARLTLQKAQASLEALKANQASGQASNQQSVSNAEANYSNARRDLETALANLQATQKLYDVGGTSAQSLQQAKDAYAKTQATLETAQVNLNTARQALSLKGSSNTQDLRNAQIAVQQAQLEVKNAEENLADTKIYAPFSGVVSKVSGQVGSVGVGATSSNSSSLLTLMDDSSVNLPAQIDESEISKVKVGQKVEVTLDAFSNETFQGTVTNITPSATVVSNIAVFYVTVRIPNPDHRLKIGMTAEGEIVIQEIKNALTVPKKAIQTVRGRAYVEVQQPDGSTETVRVELGPDDGTNQVVTGGLEAGQTIVLPTRTTTTNSQGSQGGLRLPIGGVR